MREGGKDERREGGREGLGRRGLREGVRDERREGVSEG